MVLLILYVLLTKTYFMKNKYYLLLAFAFLGFSVFAQTTVWKNEGADANWNFAEGWTEGVPLAETKTVFNVPGASDCIIDTPDAIVKQLVIGDNTAYGGTLIVKDGGVLTCTEEWSTVGYNQAGAMIIEKGGAVVVTGDRFHVGLVTPAEDGVEVSLEVEGTLTTPKFTVNDPGEAGWDASCYVYGGGIIDTDILYIGEGGLIDVTGGTIIVSGDQSEGAAMYITSGQLTAEDGDEEAAVEVKIVGTDTTTWITSSTTPVGIAQNSFERATVSVYPNPATDVVYFSENVVADVEIYSITGQLVLRQENASEINIERLNPGIYFMKGEADKKQFVGKFIKE